MTTLLLDALASTVRDRQEAQTARLEAASRERGAELECETTASREREAESSGLHKHNDRVVQNSPVASLRSIRRTKMRPESHAL